MTKLDIKNEALLARMDRAVTKLTEALATTKKIQQASAFLARHPRRSAR